LPAPYNAVDQLLKAKWGKEGGVYDKVRCGLVHEYSIKVPHTVYRHASPAVPCGILENPDPQDPSLLVILKQLIDDFFLAAQVVETSIAKQVPPQTSVFFERYVKLV
jgi:hypothetical protein